MVNELNALESKIAQVASLCHSLRTENAQLRQQLATVEGHERVLSERMEAARVRLEQLAQKLPEDNVKV